MLECGAKYLAGFSAFLWPAVENVSNLRLLLHMQPCLLRTSAMVTFYSLCTQNLNPLVCSPQQYNGSTCILELQDWQSCLPDRQNASDVLISSDVEQSVQEEKLQLLFAGLQSLHPSEGCRTAFRSFWCLVLFSLCDGSDHRRLPSYGECVTLQTKSCAVERQIASSIPELASLFQECEVYRLNTPVCRMLFQQIISVYT